MGCEFDLGDDFEKCQLMIDEYEYLVKEEPSTDKNYKNLEEEKDHLKQKIREKLEFINKNVDGLAQIDKLQKLNEKYQLLLAEESRIKD